MPYGYTAHMNTIAKMSMREQEGEERRAEARLRLHSKPMPS